MRNLKTVNDLHHSLEIGMTIAFLQSDVWTISLRFEQSFRLIGRLTKASRMNFPIKIARSSMLAVSKICAKQICMSLSIDERNTSKEDTHFGANPVRHQIEPCDHVLNRAHHLFSLLLCCEVFPPSIFEVDLPIENIRLSHSRSPTPAYQLLITQHSQHVPLNQRELLCESLRPTEEKERAVNRGRGSRSSECIWL